MTEGPNIGETVVSYLGTTCIFEVTDTVSIRASVDGDQRCCVWKRRNPCFTCPRTQVVGAEVATNSGFRIHHVKPVPVDGTKSKCSLHKTGIIDCGAPALATIIQRIRRWSCPIQDAQRNQKIFILVNPKSGDGRATKVLNNRILPILRNVIGWDCEARVTTGRGAARDIMQGANLESCSIIGVLGGDGTFHEAIQGLVRRPDWRRVLQIPVVPIPAGSGNALATSLGLYDIDTTLFAIFQKQSQKLDIISVAQEKEEYLSFLGTMYGALSAIDIGSEALRWLGECRFTVGAIKEIMKMSDYNAKFAYLPYIEVGTSNLEITQRVSSPCISMFGSPETVISSKVTEWFLNTNQEGSMGPEGWRMAPSFSTRFLAVLNLPYISRTTNFVPNASLDDGALHLIHAPVTARDSRLRMFDIFIKSETGKHLNIEGVHSEKISAFLLLPGDKKTWVTVDGEVVQNNVLLSMKLMPSFMNVITSRGSSDRADSQ